MHFVAVQAAQARANTESSTGKEAQLSDELSAVRDELDAALADKAELETALGLLDRNSKAQIEQLQVRLGPTVTGLCGKASAGMHCIVLHYLCRPGMLLHRLSAMSI